MSISQVLNCLFVCVGKFSMAKVQNNIFPASPPKYFFQLSPDFFRGTLRIRCSSSLQSNVPHVARVSKEFVLIARQCTARCSQRVAQRKYPDSNTHLAPIIISLPLSHTLQATCGTFPCNEDEHLIRSVPRKNREKNLRRAEKNISVGLRGKIYFVLLPPKTYQHKQKDS